MSAHVQRVRTTSSYSPYLHTNTHVFLPDGSHQIVNIRDEGKNRSKSHKEYSDEIKSLVDPWEKDSLLNQKDSQTTSLWKQTFGSEQYLNVVGLKRARTSTKTGEQDTKREWDSFEIAFDGNDVLLGADAEQKRKDIFDTVVEWAKTIHTPGLEGGARAFTIQDWHGLNDGSSRPHLRLEIHRVGWNTEAQIPAVVQTNTSPVIKGTTLPRMNYGSNESSEVDKDLSLLGEMIKDRFGIELSRGPQSQDKNYLAHKKAMDVVKETTQSVDKTIAALNKEPDMKEFAEQMNVDSSLFKFEQEADGKPFTLRKPTNPLEKTGVDMMNLALQIAQGATAAMGLAAAQEQMQELNENIRVLSNQTNDLQIELDNAHTERDTLKEEVDQLNVVNTSLVEEKKAVEELSAQKDVDHSAALAKLQEEQRAALEQLNAQHQANLKNIAEQHRVALEKLNAQHNVEMTAKQGLVESYKKDNDEKTQQNALLSQKVEVLESEKSKLEQDFENVKNESHQHKQAQEASQRILNTVLKETSADNAVLKEKALQVEEGRKELVELLNTNPQVKQFLQSQPKKVTDIFAKLKSVDPVYQSRMDVYIQAGMPDPQIDPQDKDAVLRNQALEANLKKVQESDAEIIRKQQQRALGGNQPTEKKTQEPTQDGLSRKQ